MGTRTVTYCDSCERAIDDPRVQFSPQIMLSEPGKLHLSSVGADGDPSGNNDRSYRIVELDLCAGCCKRLVSAAEKIADRLERRQA